MLWVALLGVFSLLFAVWGYLAARSRGRTPLVWALVCAFTFFIGIAIVYSLGEPLHADHGHHDDDQGHEPPSEDLPTTRRSQLPAIPTPLPVTVVSAENVDDKRWRYLCEYHPRISEAVRRIEPLGAEALDELKSAYLALNDATLLPGILRRIDERFGGQNRGYLGSAESGRYLTSHPMGEEDEPIDLQTGSYEDVPERGSNGFNGTLNGSSNGSSATSHSSHSSGRLSRITQPEHVTETAPPSQDYRSLRDVSADAERDQASWRAAAAGIDRERQTRLPRHHQRWSRPPLQPSRQHRHPSPCSSTGPLIVPGC
jgi:hypothetical protein